MTVIPFQEFGAPHRRIGVHQPRHAWLAIGGPILARLREWRQRARDRAELASLDDRMLRDIGLTRADTEFLSNKPFWRK